MEQVFDFGSVEEMVIRLSKNTYLDRRIAGVWPDGKWKYQYRCECAAWNWEDQQYCQQCGRVVVKREGQFFKKEKHVDELNYNDFEPRPVGATMTAPPQFGEGNVHVLSALWDHEQIGLHLSRLRRAKALNFGMLVRIFQAVKPWAAKILRGEMSVEDWLACVEALLPVLVNTIASE